MDNRMQIFEDLDVLVRMCRSKSDGASLVIEEDEIKQKIDNYNSEISEIQASAEEDNYDTSAEMADRNIEIITKKIISSIKNELKNKNSELENLKKSEVEVNSHISLLKENKENHESYINSMKERIKSTQDTEIITRYNTLIEEANEKVTSISKELDEIVKSYEKLQNVIEHLSTNIEDLEEKLKIKEEQLVETQTNLQNKDTYVDQIKSDRDNKKITDLETKKKSLEDRLEEIHNDPKYLEAQIKAMLTANEDPFSFREYLTKLIEKAINQPYMNVPADNALEEELLRATQARDMFANEMDQKSYNIMETVTPEQIRIEYLNDKITGWQNELAIYDQKIAIIDKDQQYNYQQKNIQISSIIEKIKQEVMEFKKAYEEEPEGNLSTKASLKVAYEEKKSDLEAAEQIAASFRKDEADDIKSAISLANNECENIKTNITKAVEEINNIKNRLLSKKSGLIDISAQNKDKEKLKQLANIVMDIKHRRQFTEPPIIIAKRLEQLLGLDLTGTQQNVATPIEVTEPQKEEEVVPETPNIEEQVNVEPQVTPVVEETEPKKEVDNAPENGNIISNEAPISDLDAYINNIEASLA